VAKAQTVKTGIIQKGYVEILDGLTADQTIAVDGASFLTNDAKVNIKKE
jgi:multidrug efflux pump subunit AcrA (membrane-fusion protein)